MIFLRGRHWTVILHFMVLFLPIYCNRKNKRMKFTTTTPRYEIYPSNALPSDKQVTTFLHQNQVKVFYYNSIVANGSFSVTVTACSSPITWNMTFISNDQDRWSLYNSVEEFATERVTSREGTYQLQFLSPNDTFIHVYVSTEDGGPQAFKNGKWNEIRLIQQRKKSLTVRWLQSLVDPQVTQYCLVLSPRRFYKSLCKAQSEQPEDLHSKKHKPKYYNKTQAMSHLKQKVQKKDRSLKPKIVCIGRRTHFTVKNMKHGDQYYLSVFAINKQSHLTYPRGSKYFTFRLNDRFIPLEDGVIYSLNLKMYNGKAVFKYKVGEGAAHGMNIFAIPCGGTVNVGVSYSGSGGPIKKLREVESYGNIFVDLRQYNTTKFNIRVMASDKEELKRISKVKVYVTSRQDFTNPFPQLPEESSVQQYDSLRTCNRLTIGWRPSPITTPATYCVNVKEIKEGVLRDSDEYRTPNQCDLEKKFKVTDFVRIFCLGVEKQVSPIMLHNITQLIPARTYQIQVTVKKPEGETLSYDLLYVRTRPKCPKEVGDVFYMDYHRDNSNSSTFKENSDNFLDDLHF